MLTVVIQCYGDRCPRRIVFVRFFFFQAEDGIRDLTVTGVQTCALPIFLRASPPRPICRTTSLRPYASKARRSSILVDTASVSRMRSRNAADQSTNAHV